MEFDQEPPADSSLKFRIRLVRYLFGDVTPDDRASITQRIASEPDFAAAIRDVRRRWRAAADADRPSDADLAAQRAGKAIIMAKAGLSSHTANLVHTASSTADQKPIVLPLKDVSVKQTLRKHAVVAHWSKKNVVRKSLWFTGVTLGAIIMMFIARPSAFRTHGITRTYTTNPWKQAVVMLDDGTRVILAPSTTLRLVGLGEQSRTVILDGVAFFDVTRSTGVPFAVQSGDATIRVLGTAFLVRHIGGNTDTHVSVANGKVRVVPRLHPSAAVTLAAGEVGDATDSVVRSASLEATPTREWIRGQLAFRDRPVEEILQTLTQWYGYQFHCADPELSQHIVTMVVSMQSSTDALAALEQVLNVNLTVVGDTVTLAPKSVRSAKGTPRVRAHDAWIPTAEVGR